MTYNEAVGRVIRECRRERSVSMSELGEVLGITTSAVSRLENGKTQLNIIQLRKIARCLNMDGSIIVEKAEKMVELFP